ncbi:MAG: ribonucleotide-diphosphate reductase subunit beta [Actinomycetota bacterium]
MDQNPDTGNGTGPALRLARRSPRLAAQLTRSLLAERRRVRRERGERFPLRRLLAPGGLQELARHGGRVDPGLALRALEHLIDPEWTKGERFRVSYELSGEGGGRWTVIVEDGSVRVEAGPEVTQPRPDGSAGDGAGPERRATVMLSVETWVKLAGGEISPSTAMQFGLIEAEGDLPAVTLLGRWIDRANGLDGPELERERRQRELQRARGGTWGASANGASRSAERRPDGSAIDPAQRGAGARRRGELLGYEQLYALWERSNWRAHELDFSVDREHWLATPTEAQRHTAWTLGSFYVGEERVTADLAPFLLAAPSGEVEAFLATQLVDEARHAVFFDRFAAEVMALSADDLRSRLQETEETMLGAWHFLFDDALRGVANRLLARPDDLELFVEGIVTYHMVTEGVLAMTGQRTILQYTADHGLYPGFQRGFSLVEQDEHRHIAFGVRFLRDVCEERPEMRDVALRTLERLLPRAAEVFAPPEAESPREFVSYGYHSSQVYGFAYMALQRRMRAIGIEIPPPERLMPGPIDPRGLQGNRTAAAPVTPS